MASKTIQIWDKDEIELVEFDVKGEIDTKATAKAVAELLYGHVPGQAYDVLLGAITQAIRGVIEAGHSEELGRYRYLETIIGSAIKHLAED